VIPRRSALIVAGMHRGGTSAVAGALGLMGGTLPRDLMPAQPGVNDAGFFEPLPIVSIHDELLASVNSSWDDPHPLPKGWFQGAEAKAFAGRLVAEIKEQYGDGDLLVLKDPRMSRLIPLWLEVFAELDIRPLFLIPVRHPWEVAASLAHRDGFALPKCHALWLEHMLLAEHDTRGHARSFLSYAELVQSPRAVFSRAARELAIEWPRSAAEALPEVEAFLTGRLHHHHAPADAGARQVSAPAVDAYRILSGLTLDSGSVEEEALDRLREAHVVPGDGRPMPKVVLGPRALNDYELLTSGAFAPLRTFMNRADYASCLETMRLANGALFPIPVTLPVDSSFEPGTRLALVDAVGNLLATLDVEETFEIDAHAEARAIFGSTDDSHPYIREIVKGSSLRVSGRLTPLQEVPHADFQALRLDPAAVRERVQSFGRPHVVAFQTRNPLHRSHEELIKRAAREHDATVLLHPVVGLTRPGDIDHFTRVRTYAALLDAHFEPGSAVLALLPLAMRMAGPREALWHAIIRKNYGATHFIVGRDHAGPAPDAQGRPFFGPYDAQELVGKHAAEIGIVMVPFREMVYMPTEDRFEEQDKVPPGAPTASLSGSDVRRHLTEGKPLPDWFTRLVTAAILQQAQPPRSRQGFCVWFTGLSAAGKSATANALQSLFMEEGRVVTMLDGDEVRLHLSKGLGFSRADRDTNILRIGYVASEVVRHRGIAICAAISPFREAREKCRAMMGEGFIEVFMDTSLEVCESRDPKGLYAKARAGELKGFTGIDDPYEAPLAPQIHLKDPRPSAVDNARTILGELRARGFLS